MDPTIAAVSALLILLAIVLMGVVAFMEKRQKKIDPKIKMLAAKEAMNFEN